MIEILIYMQVVSYSLAILTSIGTVIIWLHAWYKKKKSVSKPGKADETDFSDD